MLMDEQEFQREYGEQFEAAMAEARDYVRHPEKLQGEVDEWEASRDRTRLGAPRPDQFAYRMMNYRGFVRFPDRLKNHLVAKADIREEYCRSLPIMMDIEPDSRCNFRCIMCARAKEGVKSKKKPSLTFDEFRQFMDNNPQFTEVKVQGVGEPLLNPDLFEMIRYAIDRDTWVRTTVNGSLLHRNENYKKLIDSGIGEVQTSFDGATKEVFEKIRVGSDFDQVVANLKLMNDYVATKDRDYTRMWVLLQNNNRHQLLDFIELAARMGFRRMTYSVVLTGWGDEDCFDDLKTKAFTDDEEAAILGLGPQGGHRRVGVELHGPLPDRLARDHLPGALFPGLHRLGPPDHPLRDHRLFRGRELRLGPGVQGQLEFQPVPGLPPRAPGGEHSHLLPRMLRPGLRRIS